jgi:membrane protease YdiL (CAAX protease family)
VWQKPLSKTGAVLIPCLLVVINNFPIIALAIGDVNMVREDMLGLFVLDCLLIGVFEEVAFRGTIFLALLERRRASTKQIFWTTALSSAIFGLIHLANLLEGANPGATLLQVGYSFLIGGMCAICMLTTGTVWLPIFIHALYDFNGYLVPRLGEGVIWTPTTIALTAVVGVLVAAYTVILLIKARFDIGDLTGREAEE